MRGTTTQFFTLQFFCIAFFFGAALQFLLRCLGFLGFLGEWSGWFDAGWGGMVGGV